MLVNSFVCIFFDTLDTFWINNIYNYFLILNIYQKMGKIEWGLESTHPTKLALVPSLSERERVKFKNKGTNIYCNYP